MNFSLKNLRINYSCCPNTRVSVYDHCPYLPTRNFSGCVSSWRRRLYVNPTHCPLAKRKAKGRLCYRKFHEWLQSLIEVKEVFEWFFSCSPKCIALQLISIKCNAIQFGLCLPDIFRLQVDFWLTLSGPLLKCKYWNVILGLFKFLQFIACWFGK